MAPGRRRRADPARVNGIGAREKYSAKPSRSTTTLVTFGFCSSAASSMRRRSVLISSAGSVANGATAASIISGSMQRLVSLHVDDESRSRATPRLPRADRCRSDATRDVITRVAAERAARRSRSARRRSRRSRARSSAPRRRAGRRARSSAGRRCRRAPCPEDGSTEYRAGMMAIAETKTDLRGGPEWKQGARQILPQLHATMRVHGDGRRES